MLKKVAFTMYPVTDVPRARAFYEGTLGLKPGSVGSHGDRWWIEYDLPGGGCLALTDITGDKPSDTAGGTIALEGGGPRPPDRRPEGEGRALSRATSSTARSAAWLYAWTRRATPSSSTSSRRSETE